MKDEKFSPGNIVVTEFGLYQHWSIVSDRKCSDGKPMLISATKRNGTAREESWDRTTEGNHTYVVDIESNKRVDQILDDARSVMCEWSYSLIGRNCEHFVKWSLGLEVESVQVKKVTLAVGLSLLASAFIFKKPTLFKALGTACLIGSAVLANDKALSKNLN